MGKLAMTREGNVMLIAPEPDAQEKGSSERRWHSGNRCTA